MSSLQKMLTILDQYSVDSTRFTAEELANRLGYSQGTTYRYLRELTASGMLLSIGGAFALGPRVTELDFYIRTNDPYSGVIQRIMTQLFEKLECEVLFCSFYADRILVQNHIRGMEKMSMSYGRGRRMPTFLGAPSKAILASMRKQKIKQLFEDHREEREACDIKLDWNAYYQEMRKISRAGHAVSYGELDEGNVGIAVPLDINLPSSLALVFSQRRFEFLNAELTIETLVRAGKQTSQLIARLSEDALQSNWQQVDV